MIQNATPAYLTRLLKSTFCLSAFLLLGYTAEAGVTVTVPAVPATDTTSYVPTNRRYQYSAARMIYTATEVGLTGTVTAIGFYKASGSTTPAINYLDIYMKETTSTTVTTAVPSSSSSVLTGYKKVANSVPIDNSISSGWTTVALSTAPGDDVFAFSGGTNNLEVIIIKKTSETAVSGTNVPIFTYTTTTGINTTAYYYSNSSNLYGASAFTSVSQKRPNVQFTIENTCSGKPTAGSISGPVTPVCPGGNFTLTGAGVTLGTGMHYQWQSKPTASGSFTNTSADDTFANLTTSTLVNRTYRIIATCNNSGQSDTSSGFGVTVVPVPVISAATDTVFCAGGSVLLTSTSVSGVTYTWFKDGTTTGVTGTSYTASATGTYTVRASTTDCSGTNSNEKKVIVNPLPTATVTALTTTTFCDGGSVTLQASTASGMTYQWQKGGIDISGATSDNYSATTSGAYRVKITNGSTSCSAISSPVSVTVNPKPAAFTISGPGGATSYCAAGSLTLSTTPVSGLSYQWERTSGPIPTATSASYTVSLPETYTLVATLGTCTTRSNSVKVTENPLPVAGTTPTGTVSFCNGDSLKIQAMTAAGQSYEWLEGGTPIAGAPKTDFYWAKTAGKYSVRVTITATGCYDISAELEISLISPTIPTISAGGPTKFCIGGDVLLTGVVGTGLTTQWQESKIDIASATASTYTANASGSYRLKVTNGVGCAAYSDPIKVVVNPLPSASISGGPLEICNGETATLTGSVVKGNTYQWRESSVDIPGSTHNPLYVTKAGTYSVHITDSNGCEATSSDVTVTVKFVKPFSVTPHGNTYFCAGNDVLLTTQVGFTTYQWYYNGVFIPGATDTMVYASKTGKYTVKVQDPDNGCFGTSPGYNILVIPSPDSPVIVQTGTRLTAPGFKGVTYQWYKDAILLPGATDSFILSSGDGVYTVEVTNDQGCSKTGKYIIGSVGMSNPSVAGIDIHVFPNPAQSRLTIEAPDGITATLTDIQGKVLFSARDAKEIDVSDLAAGMYLIVFTDKDNQTVRIEKISKTTY